MNFNRELPIMFNGTLLNDLITPQFDVDPLLYPETTDATLSFSRGVGEQFNSRKIGIRKIKVPFFMVNPSEEKRQELTEILNVDAPKKLILGRAQDRYYMAIPDGNIETGMAKFQIASTITFICYDPLAYSLTTTTVTPDTDGKITVDYQGTYPAYPIITATMKSENGLVAFANDKGGVLQFGSPEEVDKVVPKSQILISDKMDLTLGTTNLALIRPLPVLMGQLSKTGSFNLSGKVFAVSSFGADTNSWAGPSWTLPFPTDSFGSTAQKNFSFVFRLFFVNTKPNQAGIMMYTINKADGSILASVVVKDGSLTKSVSEISLFVGEQKMQTISYSNVKTGGYAGLMSIRKIGSRFEFVYGQGVMRVFYDDTLADAEGAYATIGAGKWKGVAVPNRMEFEHYSLRADYVEATEDIPNRFSDGDVVTVDVADRKVYLNGVIDNTLQTVGNQWDMFKLDPGINTIQPVASSWATRFETKLTYREAWL